MLKALSLTLVASLALSAAPAAANPSPSAEARLAKLLDGRVAGEPVNCISLNRVRSTEIIDDTAIVYHVGNQLYVNRPRNADWLDRDDILVTRSFGSQLCEIDMVNLVDRAGWFPRGFVSLGEFVPYTKR